MRFVHHSEVLACLRRNRHLVSLTAFIGTVLIVAVLACQGDQVVAPLVKAEVAANRVHNSQELIADTVVKKKAARTKAREFARRIPETSELNVCYTVSVDPSKPIDSRYTFERIERLTRLS